MLSGRRKTIGLFLCKAYVLFDNAVYHALQGYSSGKAIEQVMQANGIDPMDNQTFQDYMHFRMTAEAEQLEDEEQYNYGDPEAPEDFDL